MTKDQRDKDSEKMTRATSTTTSRVVILWSTQSGRAKACARRAARLVRGRGGGVVAPPAICHSRRSAVAGAGAELATPSLGNCNVGGGGSGGEKVDDKDDGFGYDADADSGYYGCTFDEYGAAEFLSLGRRWSRLNAKAPPALLMFVSTTGDGEQCDAIRSTWSTLLRRSLPSDLFSSVQFALFALGDRAYGPTAYCAAGRKVAARLVQLGASTLCDVGYGDDGTPNGGVFADLDRWLDEVLLPRIDPRLSGLGPGPEPGPSSLHLSPLSSGITPVGATVAESPYKVLRIEEGRRTTTMDETGQSSPDSERRRKLRQRWRNDDAKDEWHTERYVRYYASFFASLCPATAYRYGLYDVTTAFPTTVERSGGRRTATDSGGGGGGCRRLCRLREDGGAGARVVGIGELAVEKGLRERTADPPLVGRVVSNERITAKDWVQDTRHIRIRVDTTMGDGSLLPPFSPPTASGGSDTNGAASVETEYLPYLAGDVATIHPSNPPSSVERFLSVLPSAIRSDADVPIQILPDRTGSSSDRLPTSWPEMCTLRGWLTHCADINSLPEREDLRMLASFCHPSHPMGPDHAEKLLALSETKAAALYGDYIIREKRNWADVLYDFDSIRYEEEKEEEREEEAVVVAGDGDAKGADAGGGKMTTRTDRTKKASSLLTTEWLLAMLPPIMPRHFSIASSPTRDIISKERGGGGGGGGASDDANSREITSDAAGFTLDLCVAVVQGKTLRGRPYEGLCSGYLSRLSPKTATVDVEDDLPAVRVWIKPGSFGRVPLDPDTADARRYAVPVLYVGAGTGVAPLRSLVLERDAVRSLRWGGGMDGVVLGGGDGGGMDRDDDIDVHSGNVDADDTLVFGCRKRDADFYYSDDWSALSSPRRWIRGVEDEHGGEGRERGAFFRLLPAFSRDQRHKVYVQRVAREADGGHLLARHVLERGGAVYVAGGAKMARCVRDELTECLTEALAGGERDAKALLRKMHRQGRFAVEAWS